MIRIGCSGWSYPEWAPSFYPSGNTNFLRYYVRKFSTVEINTTFYADPSPKSVKSWINGAAERKDFLFSVKMPGAISHELLLSDLETAISRAVNFENSPLSEIAAHGKLGACLIQLPPSAGKSSISAILRFVSSLASKRFRYVVEPRNMELIHDRMFISDLLSQGAGYVFTDSPVSTLENISPATYVRLHGRNREGWTAHLDKSSRYDYDYSGSELGRIAELISEMSPGSRDVFVYFNNHPHGNAPRNARDLQMMLGLGKDPQSTLF